MKDGCQVVIEIRRQPDSKRRFILINTYLQLDYSQTAVFDRESRAPQKSTAREM